MKDIVTFINESIENGNNTIMEAYNIEDIKKKCFYISFSVDEGVLNGRKVIQPIMYMDMTTRLSARPYGAYLNKTFKNYKGLQKFLKSVIDDTWVEDTAELTDLRTNEVYTVYTYKRPDYPNYEVLMKSL
jgi:hypothetical protein